MSARELPNTQELESYLNTLLQINQFKDYGPNGLQIEGNLQGKKISRIAFAVSATVDSLTKATEWGAEALIVHHGLIWSFHAGQTFTGHYGQRFRLAIESGMNLFGYHLPLDAHLELGNASGVAQALGAEIFSSFGTQKYPLLGVQAKWSEAKTLEEITQLCRQKIQGYLPEEKRPHLLVSAPANAKKKHYSQIAIITGAAKDYWPEAQKVGVDLYLTGEMSEHHWHEVQENDFTMIAAGHHATERFGVLNLESHLKLRYPTLQTIFFDSNNPA